MVRPGYPSTWGGRAFFIHSFESMRKAPASQMLKKHLENRGFVVGVYKPSVRMAIKCYLQFVLGQIL